MYCFILCIVDVLTTAVGQAAAMVVCTPVKLRSAVAVQSVPALYAYCAAYQSMMQVLVQHSTVVTGERLACWKPKWVSSPSSLPLTVERAVACDRPEADDDNLRYQQDDNIGMEIIGPTCSFQRALAGARQHSKGIRCVI